MQLRMQVAEKTDLARIVTKAKVFKLVTEGNACVGCVYEKGGQNFQEFGPVILASGGVVFGHILWPFRDFKLIDFKIFQLFYSYLLHIHFVWFLLWQVVLVPTSPAIRCWHSTDRTCCIFPPPTVSTAPAMGSRWARPLLSESSKTR